MPQEKIVRLEDCPGWFDGKTINEALFCHLFLLGNRIGHTEHFFFTSEGKLTAKIWIVRCRLPVRYDPQAEKPTLQEFIVCCLILTNAGLRMMVIKGNAARVRTRSGQCSPGCSDRMPRTAVWERLSIMEPWIAKMVHYTCMICRDKLSSEAKIIKQEPYL